MRVSIARRREIAEKVRETTGALGSVELDGVPLADLIDPDEVDWCGLCDGCDEDSWKSAMLEVARTVGVADDTNDPQFTAYAVVKQLSLRLMPEGMEWLLDVWPKWSNGDYCKFGDWWKSDKYGEFEPQQLRKLSIYTPEQLREWGQDDGDHFGYAWDFVRPSDPTYRPDKVEPPAPKALDADGVEIRVGDTVWTDYGDGPWTVTRITTDYAWHVYGHSDELGSLDMPPSTLTHRAPVLAADGRPLRKGETVWDVETGDWYVVGRIYSGTTKPDFPGHTVACCRPDDIATHMFRPSQLTHERPERSA